MSPENPNQGPNQPDATFTRVEFTDPERQATVDGAVEGYDEDDEYYAGEYDFNYRSETDETEVAEEDREAGERLSYEPFNPEAELASLRQLDAEDKQKPSQAQRAIIAERVKQFREQLKHQQQGIGRTLQTLYAQIQQDPKAPLTDILDTAAADYRLSDKQYQNFAFGIEAYQKNYTAVEQLYERHQGNAAALFETCFKQPPTGQVNVLLQPTGLHFQCFNQEDYIVAFTSNNHQGDLSKISAAARSHAGRSGGAAFAVPNSADAGAPHYSVTIENAAKNSTTVTETQLKHTEKTLNNDSFDSSFRIGPIQELTIKTAQRSWLMEVEDGAQAIHIQERHDGETETFDLLRHQLPDGRFQGWTRSDQPDQPPEHYYQEPLDFEPGRGYQSYLSIDEFGMHYTDRHPDGAQLSSVESIPVQVTKIADQAFSDKLQAHEQQHRLNVLFVPSETPVREYDLVNAAVKNVKQDDHDPEVTRKRILLDSARHIRHTLVDSTARDEILAYYQEGREPNTIFQTLSTSQLYDYRNQDFTTESLSRWSERLKQDWTDDLVLVKYPTDNSDPVVQPLTVTDAEIQSAVDRAFGPEYRHHLQTWTDTLSELEAAGHNRAEIISLLYQEPANHWVSFAEQYVPDLRSRLKDRAEQRTQTLTQHQPTPPTL